MITNLVYHIFANNTEMMWWNIRMIKKYLPIFTGKKIFTIANNTTNNRLIDRITTLLGDGNTYIVINNDSNKTYGGTGPFFELSAPMVANTNENEFLFHGHTKGASYVTVNPCVLFWTKLMYEMNLNQFDTVKNILTNHDTFGIFKCFGTAFGNRVQWHYPGAFWWVRNSSLFSYKWDEVERDACATEILPSQFISSEKAYNGLELPPHFVDPYKPYAADRLYNIDCWKSYLNTEELTPLIGEVLYADQ